MLTLQKLRETLQANPIASLHWMLPDGDFVPAHFHITEVGRIQKDFIDCGGTRRSMTNCRLQLWVATDTDHRLVSGKLGEIVQLAMPLFASEELPVEVEYEGEYLSQYPIGGIEVTPNGLLIHLGTMHTACLAPDRCGVPGDTNGCC